MKMGIPKAMRGWAGPTAFLIAISPATSALFAQSAEWLPPRFAHNYASAAAADSSSAAAMARGEREIEEFVMQALADNWEELQLAKIAQAGASSDSVRSFAVTLERDHRRIDEELRSLARRESINVPDFPLWNPNAEEFPRKPALPLLEPMTPGTTVTLPGQTERDQFPQMRSPEATPLPPSGATAPSAAEEYAMRSAAVRELMELRGVAFDQRYLDIQIEHHRASVSLYEQMANSPYESEARQFASRTLPLVIEHLQGAESLWAQRPRSSESE